MTMKYTKDHEWVRIEGAVATIGISAHAAEQLGDVVFVELPAVGRTLKKGDDMAVVESVKAASDVYSPLDGVIVEVNELLADNPELINQDPYGAWFIRVENVTGSVETLSAEEYEAMPKEG